jgi:hypothetical protein
LDKNVFRDQFINVNGGFQSFIGRQIVSDADETKNIVKLNNGLLITTALYVETKDSVADEVVKLNKKLQDKGIPLVYVSAPLKQDVFESELPFGIDNYSNRDYSLEILTLGSVEVINLKDEMMALDSNTLLNLYFVTDHHWKPEAGLWAAEILASYFEQNYGFDYDHDVLNPDNYDEEILENWYLGSQGKRVGILYGGVDNFTILHPLFKTSLESQTLGISKWDNRAGTLEDALYFHERVIKRDLYNSDPYQMYSGGNKAIQKIYNNLAINDKKILVIKDSFADAVTPFLSLTCRELHRLDLRVANRIPSVDAYIDEFAPDLVVIIY